MRQRRSNPKTRRNSAIFRAGVGTFVIVDKEWQIRFSAIIDLFPVSVRRFSSKAREAIGRYGLRTLPKQYLYQREGAEPITCSEELRAELSGNGLHMGSS